MIKESTCTGSMMVSERPSLLLSAARWIASAFNSLAHFIPMLLVRPFSLEAAWRVYRHWGRYTCRIFGIDVAFQLVNTIFTERIFQLPGLGLRLLNAFNQYDLPVLMGGVVVGATVLVTMNLVVDILYTVLDPRVRLG